MGTAWAGAAQNPRLLPARAVPVVPKRQRDAAGLRDAPGHAENGEEKRHCVTLHRIIAQAVRRCANDRAWPQGFAAWNARRARGLPAACARRFLPGVLPGLLPVIAISNAAGYRAVHLDARANIVFCRYRDPVVTLD
jgi:hypothetical protein